MKKTLLFLLCLLGIFSQSFASHFSGANIRYEYTGTGNVYRIYLTLYQFCAAGSSVMQPTENYWVSSSCSPGASHSISRIRIDTLDSRYYCDSVQTSCNSVSGQYVGFLAHVYSDTISLPPCSDWKIEWANGARSVQVSNLAAPGNYNVYVEAFLNNAAAPNNSAFCSSHVPASASMQTVTTFPFPVQDADGDSVIYQFSNPLGGPNMPIGYFTNGGYSAAQPMGPFGLAQLNTSNQTMSIRTSYQGRYALALKVSEYRNGQLIGYNLYDWEVYAYPSALVRTPPAIATPSLLNVTTCPGQPNAVTLHFVDSAATDSVFLTVTPPSIPGWSFSNTTTAAAGSGTATISWTTPTTANPVTLPYFLINVFAKDNQCLLRGAADYTVLVRLRQCNTDSVWAGDADADFTVNMYDPLAVAVAYGKTGTPRTGASTAWIAQYTANWADTFVTGINMKHADCDGNGTVNSTDLAAITANYGQVHYRGAHTAQQRNTSVPDLYFDLTGIALKRGSTVTIPVKLGTGTIPTSNVYGLATHMSINGITLATAPVMSFPSGWLGAGSNTLNFSKATSTEDVEWAYARTDHQNSSGNGTIANVTFTVPANAPVGQMVHFSFADTRIIDKNGNSITAFNEVTDSATVLSGTNVGSVTGNIGTVYIVPNPSGSNAELQITLAQTSDVSISVNDISGKTIWTQQKTFAAGAQYIQLPATGLPAGVYLVQIKDAGTQQAQVVKWVKY